jgi:type VI secretion system secreted protein VgrG
MKIPIFLRNLLQSNNYWNKNSNEFIKANEYLETLFPGKLQKDATGQYIEPEYDMTYEQFLTAQKKLDDDIEQAIQEAQGGKEDNNTDYTQFIETEEEIDVRVLMPWGDIQNEKLIVYTLSVPDDSDTEPEGSQTVWVWCGVHDELLCPICRKIIGKIFTNETDIPKFPIHPNCRCWIEERELDNNGKPISSKVYKGQKPDNKTDKNETQDMKMSDNGVNILKRFEGSVKLGGKHVIYDDKTGKPVNTNEPLPKGATIGYGHLVKSGEYFKNGISETKATELLRSDIATAERAVRDNITVPLSQNQFDALTSLAYNIGTKNFADSTVVKYINNPDLKDTTYPTLESAWKTWNKSGGYVMTGLSNRRNEEWNMFNN